MSKKRILDSIQREQSMAEERHRLLAGALREAESGRLAEAMAEEAQDMSLAELESLSSLAGRGSLTELIELSQTGELAEAAQLAELGKIRKLPEGVTSQLAELAETGQLAELAGITQTPLFAELANTQVTSRLKNLSELTELAKSGSLAALAEQAGNLSELAELTENAELAEMAELAETTTVPDGSRLGCPKGHGLMDRIRKSGLNIDRCSVCHGLWFDWGELESMLGHHLGIEIPTFAKDIDMRCPRCSGQMCCYMLPEEGVEMDKWSTEIDQCRQCEGVWLDQSELEEIQNTRIQGQFEEEDTKKSILKHFLSKVLG